MPSSDLTPWIFPFVSCPCLFEQLHNDNHLDSIYRVKDNTELNHVWPPWRFFTDKRTGSTVPQIGEYRSMMPLSHALNGALSERIGIDRLTEFPVGKIVIHISSLLRTRYPPLKAQTVA